MFPNTAAFARRRNSGDTEFTLWVNFVCMDLIPFFPEIEKHIMSVTKGKRCIELAGENEESEHFERHRGFPDMEYDGKKSMTAVGKTLPLKIRTNSVPCQNE